MKKELKRHSLSIIMGILGLIWLVIYTLAWYYNNKYFFGLAAEAAWSFSTVAAILLFKHKFHEEGVE